MKLASKAFVLFHLHLSRICTAQPSLVGPVLKEDFPDPSIIKLNETYYAFSSRSEYNGLVINTPIASSKSFQSGWQILEGVDALPDPGEWTRSHTPSVLTPDINQLDDGTFILYYIAIPKDLPNQKTEHCIGAATSPNITGPFKPQSTPILCPNLEPGVGTADPNGFAYNGSQYLVFKNASGHDAQRQSYIAIEKVAKNGYTPLSKWTDLVDSTKKDGYDVEGSALAENPTGGFVLFFTVGTFNTTDLRIEYATSERLEGRYARKGVLFETGKYDHVRLSAPVGLDVVSSNASEVVFEAFGVNDKGSRIGQMYTAILKYEGDKVILA